MAKYLNYRYIFPPRPKNAIPDTELEFWDDGSLLAQPKLNGSNCLIFTNGEKSIVMNRHNQRLTNFRISDEEVKKYDPSFIENIENFARWEFEYT